jgi:hypothetical protein
MFSEKDKTKTINRYTQRFETYGYSQKAVGWGDKGKQDLRFEVLASYFPLENMRILDVGAGFGDLYKYLMPYGISAYHGIELVHSLVTKGNEIYGSSTKFNLTEENFLELSLQNEYDICFISGLFNFKLVAGNNYEFIASVLKKAFECCQVGLAANFITDRVDYQEDLIFNSKPEKILEIILGLTKNVSLRNDYFPFEFSVFLNKNERFLQEDTIFESYKHKRDIRKD